MASWKIVSRKMAALQMAIAVYRSGRFGFGRPGTVPCRGAVHAFLHGMAFCIACTAETYAYPNARSQSSDGFTGNKLGFHAWIQQAVRADRRLALSRQWVWIPYRFHICAQPATGNRQLATGNKYAPHIHPSILYSTNTSQADESSCIPQRFVGLTTQGRAPSLRRNAAESARPCRRRPAPPARWRRRRRHRRPAGRPAPRSCRRPGRPARCP